MMLNTVAAKFPFDYYIVRSYLLKYLEENELTTYDRKFFYPLEETYAGSLSLTEGIDPENQIRFFLKDRVVRKLNEIAKRINEKGISTVEMQISHFRSTMVQYLAQAFGRMGVKVILNDKNSTAMSDSLTENELNLVSELGKAKAGNLNIILSSAKKIINSGDIFTAERIIEHGIKFLASFETENAQLIGIVKNCLGKTLEAEHYYNLNKIDGDALKIIYSNYTLSMLYLRHHKPDKKNFQKGKDFLNEAFDKIKSGSLTYLDKEDQDFHEVFNRNGYGLVLFREGHVEEAIQLLRWGINRLSDGSAKHHMHKSVILYNISQCYKKVGDYESAIECYNELLTLDPGFPEYHLELGLCMSEKGDNEGWEKCILRSLEINQYHSDSHYFYSLYLADGGNFALSEKHARLAWELSGNDITAYNLAYICSLNNKYENLEDLIPHCGNKILADWFILVAEKELANSKKKAEEVLRTASHLFPEHQGIMDNLALVQSEEV